MTMRELTWDETFKTGIENVDHQHQGLFGFVEKHFGMEEN